MVARKVTGRDMLCHRCTAAHNTSCAGAIGWMWDVTELTGSMFPKPALLSEGALMNIRNCCGNAVMRLNQLLYVIDSILRSTQLKHGKTIFC